jgi:hypothetical protein
MRSDSSVGVEHHAEVVATNSVWGEVLGELGLDETRVTVAGHDLAPHGLVVGASLLVLSLEDVSDALSVVEKRALGLVATFDLEDSLGLELSALSTLKVHKCGSLVESGTTKVRMATLKLT